MMRLNMLRLCCFVFVLFLIGSMVGCGGSSSDGNKDPVTPTTQQANLRWWFEGDYHVPIHLQIYSQDRSWVWPDANTVFVFPNDDQPHYFDTVCNVGEKLCFGAWPSDNTPVYWGVGPNDAYDCTACCTICEEKTVGPLILD